ncbi:MAG: hypothetical protein NUV98_02065 [Candidatus Roizmanbacteria bacterium]|nr:hypothetical protein [Candidatus Roizmanbacteria bacterium]
MGNPESSFRRYTRSNTYPNGIKLKDIPHSHWDAISYLKSAREGTKFEVQEGSVRPVENNHERLKVVRCQPYGMWGMYPNDRNVILEVVVAAESAQSQFCASRNPQVDEDLCSRCLLVDEDLGRNLASLDDKALDTMMDILPEYIQDLLDNNRFTLHQSCEGVFLERKL